MYNAKNFLNMYSSSFFYSIILCYNINQLRKLLFLAELKLFFFVLDTSD